VLLCCAVLKRDEVEEDEMGTACNTYGRNKNTYKILTRKSQRNRPLGSLKLR
jgi:hypothetical protein